MKWLLLFFACLPCYAIAQNHAPVFISGTSQQDTVCPNSFDSIGLYLKVFDSDMGQTETWSVVDAPMHGLLLNFPVSMQSTGDTLQPMGLVYLPISLYYYNDSFTIQVSDGIDSAITAVHVSVNCTTEWIGEMALSKPIVYPNPSNGQFTVLANAQNDIQIYNGIGQQVYNSSFYNRVEVDISKYPAGIYYAKINGIVNEIIKR